MKTIIQLILLVLFFNVGNSFAEDTKADHPVKSRLNNDYMKADVTLDNLYKKVVPVLGEDAQKFKQVQSMWVKVKEQHCNYIKNSEGGDINQCLLSMTKNRTGEILHMMLSMGDSRFADLKQIVSELFSNMGEAVYQDNTYWVMQEYWDNYFKANCELLTELTWKDFGEDYRECLERLYRPLLQSPRIE